MTRIFQASLASLSHGSAQDPHPPSYIPIPEPQPLHVPPTTPEEPIPPLYPGPEHPHPRPIPEPDPEPSPYPLIEM